MVVALVVALVGGVAMPGRWGLPEWRTHRHRLPLALVGVAMVALGAVSLGGISSRGVETLGAAEPLRTAAPVVVNTSYGSHPDPGCGWRARLPDTVDGRTAPPMAEPDEVFDWVIASGGALLSPVPVVTTVRPRPHPPTAPSTTVVGMVADVEKRLSPLTGPEIHHPCPEEGVGEDVGIEFDLDEPFAVARTSGPGEPFFARHAFGLDPGQALAISSLVHTASDHVIWRMAVRVDSDGRDYEVSSGGPILRTASADGPASNTWTLRPDEEFPWSDADGFCARPGASAWNDRCGTPDR